MKLEEIQVRALRPDRLLPLIGPERMEQFDRMAEATREMLAGRSVVNVSSTRTGGGTAETLRTLLTYVQGSGINAQWVVMGGDPGFYAITKRIRNHLSGAAGDAGPLGPEEHGHYEEVLHANAAELANVVRPRDIAVLHDPQAAGLAHDLMRAGVTVVWRCHVGCDAANEYVNRAWSFLHPYLEDVDAYVVSRATFAPPWANANRVLILPPAIDPFAPKNQAMSPHEAADILRYVGLVGGVGAPPRTEFTRADGSPARVNKHADVLQTGPPPPVDAPLVAQLSRWDRLKDMAGVMAAFADRVVGTTSAHLLLAGPAVTGVVDDPEAVATFDECTAAWRDLPHAQRTRIHIACLPTHDPDEYAAITNAIQRHATVVTQKSIAEGSGVAVAEAMWKAKPIVASAVGCILDEIVSGEEGLLIEDPHDLAAFGQAVRRLLENAPYASQLGTNAGRRAGKEFLWDRHLEHYWQMFAQLEKADTV